MHEYFQFRCCMFNYWQITEEIIPCIMRFTSDQKMQLYGSHSDEINICNCAKEFSCCHVKEICWVINKAGDEISVATCI